MVNGQIIYTNSYGIVFYFLYKQDYVKSLGQNRSNDCDCLCTISLVSP